MVLELWPCSNVSICTEECVWHPEKKCKSVYCNIQPWVQSYPVFLAYGVFDGSMLVKSRPAGGGMELISHAEIGSNGSMMIKASAGLLQSTKTEGLWSQSPYYSLYYYSVPSDIPILSFISPQSAASTGNSSTEARPRTTPKRRSNI